MPWPAVNDPLGPVLDDGAGVVPTFRLGVESAVWVAFRVAMLPGFAGSVGGRVRMVLFVGFGPGYEDVSGVAVGIRIGVFWIEPAAGDGKRVGVLEDIPGVGEGGTIPGPDCGPAAVEVEGECGLGVGVGDGFGDRTGVDVTAGRDGAGGFTPPCPFII